MKYPVRIYRDGEFWMAWSPDVDRVTQGYSLDEALHMAADLLALMLFDKPSWPVPSNVSMKQRAPDELSEEPGEWHWVAPSYTALIALQVQDLRKKRGWTMQETADRLGVKVSTYQRWENPKTCNPTVSTLERLAKAFDLELDLGLRAS